MNRIAIAVVVVVAACGGGGPKTTNPTTTAPKHEEHEAMSPELAAFHDTLAPLWHAEVTPQRTLDTCNAVPDLEAKAAAVRGAPPPAGVEEHAWNDAVVALESAVGGLKAACLGPDPLKFQPAFEKVHASFHAAMELGEGEHGEKGEEHEMHEMDHGEPGH